MECKMMQKKLELDEIQDSELDVFGDLIDDQPAVVAK
jgi:hypothetical protein